jgi:RimJ/RimL family protein N-acetyltransferase
MLPPPPARIDGGAVVLRPFADQDVPLVVAVVTDPLIPLITTVPTSGSTRDAQAYIDRQNGRFAEGIGYSFAIADAASDGAVGQIGLWTRDADRTGRASIGYWVASAFRRRGHAAAALAALVGWASGLPELERLELYVEPWNRGSWRTAEACGFQREGLLRSWQRVGAERRDMFLYSLLPGRGDRV